MDLPLADLDLVPAIASLLTVFGLALIVRGYLAWGARNDERRAQRVLAALSPRREKAKPRDHGAHDV